MVASTMSTFAKQSTSGANMPAWERAIRLHHANLKHCIKTEDFQYVQASKAQAVHSMLRGQTFEETTPEAKEKIQQIQTKDTDQKQEVMGQFTDTVRDLPNTTPNQDDWINKINEQRQKAKDQADKGIDEAADKVIETIQELPPGERSGAADFAVTASNIVMNVVGVLIDKMKEVAGQIADFFKGIWDGLKNAFNAVADAAKSAVDAIRGLFGGLFIQDLTNGDADQVAVSVPVNGGLSVPPVIQFIGRLNWPAAVGMTTATAGLAYVTEQLLRHRVTYTSQTVERVDAGGKTVIESKTTIGPMKSSVAQVGNDDLKTIWLDCVGDLGDDGHYVPATAF